MAPYANFLFFGLMLYLIVPTIILGLFGRANARWAMVAIIFGLCVQFWDDPDSQAQMKGIAPLWLVAGFTLYEGFITLVFLQWKTRLSFYIAMVLALAPLVATKFWPLFHPDSVFGFLGISYVTFRALDVIFSIHDRVITKINPSQYFAYLFFFPVVSSGPIDRYRRFSQDWTRIRNRNDFLEDLDAFVNRVFQGFLYKFIIAALLKTYCIDALSKHTGFWAVVGYMYAYTFYLFFDFAGYSAFAIGFSRLFGIRTPENFDKPFLSRNIKEFWTRWHISLSFWFRDHVYMRFLLMAAKKKWFKGKYTASNIGLFLTFGIMGIWHGTEIYYIVYGLYHATLLVAFDAFVRWNKQKKFWGSGPWWHAADVVITFHSIAFSLLIFSGRIFPHPVPQHEEIAENADCDKMYGYVWDAAKPNEPLSVDISVDDAYVGRVVANEYREDLKQKGYGNGCHGFTFKFPEYTHLSHAHVVDAKVVGSDRPLHGTPVTVKCPYQ